MRRDAPLTLGRWLCSDDDAATLEGLFRPRVETYDISPRKLSQALETVRLCAAFRAAQAESANAYFANGPTLARHSE